MKPLSALTIVKTLHTAVWGFFVTCILGAPWAAHVGQFKLAAAMVAIVSIEAVVLQANSWVCPLTRVAARYTEQRQENFDIFLPRWLAKYNKVIFTPLYLLGALYCLVAWLRQS